MKMHEWIQPMLYDAISPRALLSYKYTYDEDSHTDKLFGTYLRSFLSRELIFALLFDRRIENNFVTIITKTISQYFH